jgi:hypothetical protein
VVRANGYRGGRILAGTPGTTGGIDMLRTCLIAAAAVATAGLAGCAADQGMAGGGTAPPQRTATAVPPSVLFPCVTRALDIIEAGATLTDPARLIPPSL